VVSSHHPWLASILSLAIGVAMGSLSFCLWRGIGPKTWYRRGDKLWRLLATGTLPLTACFVSLATFGAAKTARLSIHSGGLKGLLLFVEIVAGVILGFGIIAAISLFYSEKPKSLIPPPFRGDSQLS
jgi:hypothetical protein